MKHSHPFIIWTRQRTGGISLFTGLCAASEHPAAEIEPFDFSNVSDRQFSDVGKRLLPAERNRRLREIADSGSLIKHCYENLSDDFNLSLARTFTRAGYRHIHLTRKNELARLISKGIAEQQGTWGNHRWTQERYAALLREGRRLTLDVAALRRYRHLCDARWLAVSPILNAFEITTEQVFARHGAITALVAYLDLPPHSTDTIICNLGTPHGTARMYHLIENLPELITTLGAAH